MQIIQANLAHLDAAVALFDGYRQFYQQPHDLDGARRFITERLTSGDSVIFLALGEETGDKQGNALGFTQLYPSFSSVSMAPLWILNDLFVAEAARGRGVGEALLKQAAEFGKETGAVRLELQTEIDNTAAQRLYEKAGWTRETDAYHYSLPI